MYKCTYTNSNVFAMALSVHAQNDDNKKTNPFPLPLFIIAVCIIANYHNNNLRTDFY